MPFKSEAVQNKEGPWNVLNDRTRIPRIEQASVQPDNLLTWLQNTTYVEIGLKVFV